MKINIKRIDKTLPLPAYKTGGACAFDLYSRVNMTIKPGSLGYIPTNLIIRSPKDHVLIIAPRSSSPKRGLIIPHGIGIVDSDYCGENDEITFLTLNFTKKPVKIERGERIGQAMFVRFSRVKKWNEKNFMNKKSRGGFGSTGFS